MELVLLFLLLLLLRIQIHLNIPEIQDLKGSKF